MNKDTLKLYLLYYSTRPFDILCAQLKFVNSYMNNYGTFNCDIALSKLHHVTINNDSFPSVNTYFELLAWIINILSCSSCTLLEVDFFCMSDSWHYAYTTVRQSGNCNKRPRISAKQRGGVVNSSVYLEDQDLVEVFDDLINTVSLQLFTSVVSFFFYFLFFLFGFKFCLQLVIFQS